MATKFKISDQAMQLLEKKFVKVSKGKDYVLVKKDFCDPKHIKTLKTLVENAKYHEVISKFFDDGSSRMFLAFIRTLSMITHMDFSLLYYTKEKDIIAVDAENSFNWISLDGSTPLHDRIKKIANSDLTVVLITKNEKLDLIKCIIGGSEVYMKHIYNLCSSDPDRSVLHDEDFKKTMDNMKRQLPKDKGLPKDAFNRIPTHEIAG